MLTYYWHPEKKEVRTTTNAYAVPWGFLMVDTLCTSAHYKYGYLNKGTGQWEHRAFEFFPPEFKLELLLLGVN